MTNPERIGDVVEALLAYAYDKRKCGCTECLQEATRPWRSSNISPWTAARFWKCITYGMHRIQWIEHIGKW